MLYESYSSNLKFGVMQGRLSRPYRGLIQSFPFHTWRDEFNTARTLGFDCIEWTIDSYRYSHNPLLCSEGRTEINSLINETGVIVNSITYDYFMEYPPWLSKNSYDHSLDSLIELVDACKEINIEVIVLPLVDNSSLNTNESKEIFAEYAKELSNKMNINTIKFALESDLPPLELGTLIKGLNQDLFYINYDIGNSASLGYDPQIEIEEYGLRILNVHVKDRLLGGSTVNLGSGNADFPIVSKLLKLHSYDKNLILQPARGLEGYEVATISQQLKFTKEVFQDDFF